MKRTLRLSPDSTVAAVKDQISANLGGEVVILHLQAGVYYGLQEKVGARVWDLLREPVQVRKIRDALVKEYAVEPERCARDLMALLEEMASEGIVEVKHGISA